MKNHKVVDIKITYEPEHMEDMEAFEKKINDFLDGIKGTKQSKILIIHGTDTMDKTAEFLEDKIKDKCIVLTGAMVPFSIDFVEATANISTAIGYMLNCEKNGIYICMHGIVDIHNRVFKNREIGVFQKR
ncbi:MAG: asparaginase domain-containing protein [Sulfurospirillum sp.]